MRGTRPFPIQCKINDRSLARERSVGVKPECRKEHLMMDAIMLAIGLGFFALSVGYVLACDRL